MADVKISGLPASTTPLAGTEVLPIVQGGQTRQVSVNNLTTGKSVSATSFVPSGATIPTNGVYLPAANSVGFATNSAEKARIDANGVLGVGVIPASWGTTFSQKAIQVSTSATFSALDAGAGNVQLNIGNNAYDFGIGAKYVTTNSAAAYKMVGQQHQWLNAASGTAGNAITFTQAMTLFASGGLALGSTADPGATSAYIEGTLKTGGAITAGGTAGDVLFGKYSNSFPSSGVGYFKLATNSADATNGGLSIFTLASGALAERVRVFSSGGVSIGNTTDPGATNLSVTGNVVMATSGKGIDFSATSSGTGTATSELFSDYEEGTWTPVATPTSGAFTTVSTEGTYTKIGRMVTVCFNIYIADKGTAAGYKGMSGLPFTSANTNSVGSGAVRNGLDGTTWSLTVTKNTTTIFSARYDNSNAVVNNDSYAGSVTYFV